MHCDLVEGAVYLYVNEAPFCFELRVNGRQGIRVGIILHSGDKVRLLGGTKVGIYFVYFLTNPLSLRPEI